MVVLNAKKVITLTIIFNLLFSIKVEDDGVEIPERNVESTYIEEEIVFEVKKREREEIKEPQRGSIRPRYNLNDLTEKSYVTIEHLEKKLEGTSLYEVAKDYVLAEEKYGINAIFLCALSIQESGWGRSKLAMNKNNIFGYGAYNKSPYKSAKYFNSKSECIDVVARHLVENYLTEGGKYYNGKSLDAVNKRYSLDSQGNPNKEWYKNISLLMKQLSQ